jgi:hypothetical protein
MEILREMKFRRQEPGVRSLEEFIGTKWSVQAAQAFSTVIREGAGNARQKRITQASRD